MRAGNLPFWEIFDYHETERARGMAYDVKKTNLFTAILPRTAQFMDKRDRSRHEGTVVESRSDIAVPCGSALQLARRQSPKLRRGQACP